MLRLTTLRLLPTLRHARRSETTLSTSIMSHPEAEYEKFMKPLKHKGIRPGAMAYVWEVPKDLPENDFSKRRTAVAEHAACERPAFSTGSWGMADVVGFQRRRSCGGRSGGMGLCSAGCRTDEYWLLSLWSLMSRFLWTRRSASTSASPRSS